MSPDPSVIVRPARPGDTDALLRMNAALAALHDDTPRIDAATLRRDAFGPDCWIELLVAEAGGETVGYAALTRRYRLQHGARGLDIHHLYVETGRRGRGIGRALLDGCVARARALGCNEVSIATTADNIGARRLYEAFGFREKPVRGPRFMLTLTPAI